MQTRSKSALANKRRLDGELYRALKNSSDLEIDLLCDEEIPSSTAGSVYASDSPQYSPEPDADRGGNFIGFPQQQEPMKFDDDGDDVDSYLLLSNGKKYFYAAEAVKMLANVKANATCCPPEKQNSSAHAHHLATGQCDDEDVLLKPNNKYKTDEEILNDMLALSRPRDQQKENKK